MWQTIRYLYIISTCRLDRRSSLCLAISPFLGSQEKANMTTP